MMGGPSGPGLSCLVGVGVMVGPRTLGVDQTQTRGLPMLQLRWGDGWFAGLGGVGYRWAPASTWSAGLRLGLDRGRDEGDAAALKGLGNIPSRPVLGAFAQWRPLPFLMSGADVRFGSGRDRNGLAVDLSLRTVLPVNPRVRMMAGVRAQWANQAEMGSLWGVNATQAAASGHAVYQPNAGWSHWGPRVMAMADLGGSWQLMLQAEQKHLLGDARKSPWLREERGTTGMLMLARRF